MASDIPWWKIGLRMRCPACARAPLFKGLLDVHHTCTECDFPLHQHNAEDGPPFFVISIQGTIITPFILWLDTLLNISAELLVLIAAILIILSAIPLLRVCKSCMIALQYRNKILGFKKE